MTDDADADAGFFRNLSGLATEYVRQKRKSLQSEPQTNVDSSGGGHGHTFDGQDLTFEDLRDIKDMRDSGGQVAQLMDYKALLNFGEGAEIHVENDEETEELIDGEPMTLSEWLTEDAFPKLDLLILDLGGDALWYPYAVGEIQETVTDDFKRALPAEPWTLIPQTDAQGEVVAWHQRTKNPSGGYTEQTLPAQDLWHIVVNKASARDETGISEVLRNKDEIQAFKENEAAINQAIELHGFPQRHVKVGKEDGAPVRDGDLRRVRTIFDPRTSDANTAYFTGQDVDVETLEAHQFDYQAIHEMDMRNLTTALGLPLEAGNVGSDGLGSGKPAELRFALLKLAIKANQRSFSVQFVERVMRPVIRDYSPFDHTADITLSINDPLEDIGDMADVIQQIGGYMTNEQVADRLDISAPEDDDIAESYRSPADIEKAEEEGSSDDPFGGMFNDALSSELEARGLSASKARTLQEDFDADLFELVATEDQEDFETGARLGIGVDFPNSGVYVDWNIDAWPEEERLDGPHVSEYATVEDARTVAQGEVKTLAATDIAGRDTGNSHRCLGVSDDTLAHADDWDRALLEMHQGVTDPNGPTDRALVDFAASGTPAFVLDRIREAVDDGAMFSQFEEISGSRLMDLRSTFKDELGQDDFTLDSITDTLMDFEADLSRDEAERIARTESSAVLNRAREIGYEERGEADELFYWTGAEPGSDRQTEACEWLIEQTNPFYGGEPVPMDELRDMLTDAAEQDPDIPKTMVRPDSWTIHINERSTLAKAPPNWEQL